uniref:Sperm acrosome associated 1 n=2 Tax=Anas TaxID=8835 RepID=A0A493TY18_ANAPP|nr:sperm acrosome membrane-associated protein 1 isoform X1 [Anas platyrhynchos]XP_038033674.1 sperm acrosome membrane-associated protein 1 isoform X2 [Anas platyrhynchos]
MAGGAALLLPLLLLLPVAAAEPPWAGDDGDWDEEAVAEPRGGRVLPGLNALESMDLEFGLCTVTCGIGIREILLMNGCPGGETKCIVGVEECHGPVDCGLGRPISENSKSVVMTCIYIPPENRFKYVWKIIAPNKTAHILPNDSAVMEVHRDTHPITYQCETQGNESVIASVKYTVHATTEHQTKQSERIEAGQSRKKRADAILVFCLVTGIIFTLGVIFAIIFVILHWAIVKAVLGSKNGQDDTFEKLTNKSSQSDM